MLLPLFEYFLSEQIEIKYECEQYVHLHQILTQNDLFEFTKRQLIHSETDEICKYGEESAIIFPVCASWEFSKDKVIGYFKETPISLATIEDLFHEYSFCVLAFETR